MSIINLLPAHHRERLHASRIRQRWIIASLAYAAALAFCSFTIHAVFTIEDRSVPTELRRLKEKSAQIEKEQAATIAQLAPFEAQASLREIVNAPPDVAVLLTAISKSCNEDAVLTSLKWDNAPAAQASPSFAAVVNSDHPAFSDPFAGPTEMKIEISGLARSQTGIGLYVQRLQSTRLFDDVRLSKTSREGFLSGTALAFQLTCLIAPSAHNRSTP